MARNRLSLILLILAGIFAGLSGIVGNLAVEVIPESWKPHLWLAWVLFAIFALASIALAVWQHRLNEGSSITPTPPPAQPSTPAQGEMAIGSVTVDGGQSSANYDYDVFISYSHKDKAWVIGTLLPRLEAAGLRVCIDIKCFELGAPIVTEMERALLASRKTLLVITPAYLESTWTEFEALMLQVLDPANRARRLIPLLKKKCNLPPRIRFLNYVNLVDPEDIEAEWRKLLPALNASPHKLERKKLDALIAWLKQHRVTGLLIFLLLIAFFSIYVQVRQDGPGLAPSPTPTYPAATGQFPILRLPLTFTPSPVPSSIASPTATLTPTSMPTPPPCLNIQVNFSSRVLKVGDEAQVTVIVRDPDGVIITSEVEIDLTAVYGRFSPDGEGRFLYTAPDFKPNTDDKITIQVSYQDCHAILETSVTIY